MILTSIFGTEHFRGLSLFPDVSGLGMLKFYIFLREYSVSLKSMEKVMNCTLLTLSYVNLHNICLWPENHNILSFFKGIFSSLNLKQEGS